MLMSFGLVICVVSLIVMSVTSIILSVVILGLIVSGRKMEPNVMVVMFMRWECME
jgi:hypothetical protein